MTPKEAAAALVAAIPRGLTLAQLQEYGIEATERQAQAIVREVLALNLFWVFGAIDAHIPQKYQAAVSELVLEAVQGEWPMRLPDGERAWTAFLNDWQHRRKQYQRFVQDGASPLAVSTEAAGLMQEQGIVKEEDHRNVLTLLIDFVPVDSYGKLLEDIG